ncbi:MAG: hypothetical protein RRB13_10665 [bacterium]|nr:hypothetical protein [bacterium]
MRSSSKALFAFSWFAVLGVGGSALAPDLAGQWTEWPSIGANLGLRLWAFSLAIAWVFALIGWGCWAGRGWLLPFGSGWLGLVVRAYLGLAVWGALWSALGLFQWIHPATAWGSLLVGWLGLLGPSKEPVQSGRTRLSHSAAIVGGLLVLALWLRLLAALSFHGFGDPLYYGLPSGRDYFAAGGFLWLEHAEFYAHAGLAEVHLIPLQVLARHPAMLQLTAQTIFFLLGPLSLVGLSLRYFAPWGKTFALLAALATVFYSHLRLESLIAKPDYLLGNLCLLLLLTLQIGREQQRPAWGWFWAILWGALALAIKPTAVLAIGPLGLSFLIFRRLELYESAKAIFWALLLALGLLALAYGKNLMIYGNPVFPLAQKWFHSPYWDDLGTQRMQILFHLQPGSPLDYLSRLGRLIAGDPSVLLVLALAGGLWLKNRDAVDWPLEWKELGLATLLGLAGWVAAFGPEVFTRFLIGPLRLGEWWLWLSAASLLQAQALRQRQGWKNWAWLLALGSLAVSDATVDLNQASRWFNGQSFHQNQRADSPLVQLLDHLNQQVGPDDQVLFYNANERLYAQFKMTGARSYSPRTRWVYSEQEAEVMQGLKELKAKYFVIENLRLDSSEGLMAQRAFLERHLIFAGEVAGFSLFLVPRS